MIPKYPFQVLVTSHNGDPSHHLNQTKSFETPVAAMAYMAATARLPKTLRLQLLMVLEDQQVKTAVDLHMR